jgi:hypothetical protein
MNLSNEALATGEHQPVSTNDQQTSKIQAVKSFF